MLIIRGLSAPEFSSEDDGRASAIPLAPRAGRVVIRISRPRAGVTPARLPCRIIIISSSSIPERLVARSEAIPFAAISQSV
jgi:hypothetical protein